jgi:hypothetical protein
MTKTRSRVVTGLTKEAVLMAALVVAYFGLNFSRPLALSLRLPSLLTLALMPAPPPELQGYKTAHYSSYICVQ